MCLLAASGFAAPLEFNRDIRPILSEHCFACHGPDSASRKADLRLDQRESALELHAIVPGKPDDSELLRRVLTDDPAEIMPPTSTKKPLSPAQKEALKRWIAQGAEYQAHWSFRPIPKVVDVPRPADRNGWIRNPIDAFVLDRLQKEGLQPAPEATKETWLRRISFDLTGLPPTLAEIDAFLADESPDAYRTVTDRLMDSPAYGERMAYDWLDAARYADTFGYQSDRDMHVWPWRDWVIQSFQRNQPYNEFILWQTAGDLIPGATRESKLATAFNRLHRQTNEGGSIEEEFRVEYIADRLRTNGLAFLGLTFECCRCHDHKFDPVSQREYYALSAFFNNIDEHGLYSHFTETAPTPALLLYEGDQEARHKSLLAKIEEGRTKLSALRDAARQAFANTPWPGTIDLPEPAHRFTFDDLQPAGDYKPVEGRSGKAIEFGGDDPFVCKGAGAFDRATPFSLSLWVKATEHQPRQIVVHRSRAAEDSAFRGYSLVLDEGHPQVSLVHFWPGNAIRLRAKQPIALNTWTQIAFTYDGSSKAAGVRLYVDGAPVEVEVLRDRLTRDFVHRAEWGDYDAGSIELALGARFRDVGFKNGAVDDFSVFNQELTPVEVALLAGKPVPADEAARFEHFWLRLDHTADAVRQELANDRKAENAHIGLVRQVMVMQEQPWRRKTHVLARGAYTAPTDEVEPDTPKSILEFPAEFPRNRLGFAKWMIDERNPLTARVAVNRIWQQFFGRGLVASSEDFGVQGQSPSHPELLDYLARGFIESDWNVMVLCEEIALSATYRQSSTPRDPRLYESDPDNFLMARGPRHRLSAEQLRDNALAVSGLLVNTVGGPSVFPYQPAGVWEESGTGKTYHQSHGDGLYRRSLYTFWRRTSPPPSMVTFDAPSREYCLARRERTATPLQSLVLLNDTQFVEAARVLAEMLMKEQADLPARLAAAFRLTTSRRPTERELVVLRELHAQQLAHYAAHQDQAELLVKAGEAPRDAKIDAADLAATTALVQTLLNFDESVTKR